MEPAVELFDISRFMPHGMCYLWRPDLLILHVGSDLLIALAYFTIPAGIYAFVSRRPEAKWGGVWILFCAFILLCGTTHLASIVTVWYPAYYVEGLFKFATAIVSVTTAVSLWLLIPHAMTVPSVSDIEARNEEIERLNHQLQQRIDSLTTLAGGVSHDFNNMLTVIQGHAQLLEQSNLSEEQQTSIGAILESTTRATNVCRQMLAFSGRGHFVLSSTNLNDVVSSARLPTAANCDIRYSLAQSLPTIQAAPAQIGQMIVDLCTNAVEAIDGIEDKGLIEISTYTADLDADDLANSRFEHSLVPGEAVILEIKDNGVGMSHQLLDRLFEPYFSTKFTGRGLGMAAVQGTVRGHGGCLFVDTAEGAGTAIRIAFPSRSEPSVQYRAPQAPHPRCVLVIDDEPHIADLAERYLREFGIDVITATNGDDALRLARKHADELDAIIVDYLLPRVTGAEIIDAILQITDVDAYLTSGYSRGEVDEPALRKQLTGFIPKPYSREDFRKLFGDSTTTEN